MNACEDERYFNRNQSWTEIAAIDATLDCLEERMDQADGDLEIVVAEVSRVSVVNAL